MPRDELAEVLWADELPATWEKAIRVLMTKLRALLEECGIDGSTALTSAFGCYKLTLPAGAWIDVDAALEAVERAQLALAAGELGEARSHATTAAALARRSFLPGEDGAWVEQRRRDLREVLVRALECQRDAAFAAEDFDEAARHAEEVTELEPFRESGYRRLMQAHAAAGNPAEALRVYERCRRFLADELGAYPSPETEAAYVEILRAKRPSARPDGTPLGTAREPVRGLRRVVLAGAFVLAVFLAVGTFQLVRDEGGGASLLGVEGNAFAALDGASGVPRKAFEAPVRPTAMAAGLGYVWAASADSNTVIVVDPRTNTVRDTIAVDSAPGGIAVGAGSAWVTNSLSGSVSRISPETLSVVQTIRVGNSPTGIAAGNGYVWVANTSDHTVTKLRASDGKPVDTFAVGPDPGAVAVADDAVWVASKLSATVVKLSQQSGEVLDRVPVGDGPAAIGVDDRSVWVASGLAGTVSRLDRRTGEIRNTFDVGPSADALAVEHGSVWVASELAGTVSRIVGRDTSVTSLEKGRPTALAQSGGTVYVGLRPSGAAHVGGALRVLHSNRAPQQIDPANAYYPEAWRTLVLTNDGLVAFRRAGGQAGTELVPDLAVAPPSVSDDGRRYTFQLRSGIRYSDGRSLKASDVRYSLERVYKLEPEPQPAAVDFYRAIVGAARCAKRRSHCDLSRGIVTDDAEGTVTFRLSAPDPEFLFKLALPFAYVVPKGTSLREAVQRPLPGTGPYRIVSTSRIGSLRLTRNPSFREWSSAAQPAGYPDEILIRAIEETRQRWRLVAGGKADYMTASGEPLTVAAIDRPRLHIRPLPATFHLMIDTTRPPFDRIGTRRAVNFAVDRNRVVRLGGSPPTARATCQVLPPNFPGYRRYCPYTADPGRAPQSTAARAKRLVAASGTAGMGVALWWHESFGKQVGRYLEQQLDSLGYRVRLRVFSGDIGRYFAALEAPGASWNLAGNAWYADYPTPSTFINVLACSSPYNPGHFCDRAIDAKLRRALRLQTESAVAANESWAALDRDLTDSAAWVALYTPYSADFVSKGVGNYQHHPVWGALFGQIWLRE